MKAHPTQERTNVEAQERVCGILWQMLREAGVAVPYRIDHHDVLGEFPCYDAENSQRGAKLVGAALPEIMEAFGYGIAEIQ